MGNSNLKIQMDEQIFLARVAEQAERFEDMVNFLKAAIAQKGGEDFTVDERNLLSVGFKNLIGSQRGAIRTIGAIEQNPKYSKFSGSLQGYKTISRLRATPPLNNTPKPSTLATPSDSVLLSTSPFSTTK